MVQPTTKGQIPSAEAACSAEDDHTETSGGQERQQTQRSQALMNGRIAPAPRPPGRCGEPRPATPAAPAPSGRPHVPVVRWVQRPWRWTDPSLWEQRLGAS